MVGVLTISDIMNVPFMQKLKCISNFKSVCTQEVTRLLYVSIASSMESKRTFLIPERNLDNSWHHECSIYARSVECIKFEVCTYSGSEPSYVSPLLPLRSLRGRSWLLRWVLTVFDIVGGVLTISDIMNVPFIQKLKCISNFKSVLTPEVTRLLHVSIASSMESKRTFLIPERNIDNSWHHECPFYARSVVYVEFEACTYSGSDRSSMCLHCFL